MTSDRSTQLALADVLRIYREHAGLTQTGMASLLGVHAQSYGTWERGRGAPTAERDDELVAMFRPYIHDGRSLADHYEDAVHQIRQRTVVNRREAVQRRLAA